MDYAKEYIKMCEKAVEIQKLWKVKEGDYAYIVEREYNNDLNEPVIITEISRAQEIIHFSALGLKNDYGASWFYPERNIWLPKQDQLQEMVIDKKMNGWGAASEIAGKFHKWMKIYCDIYTWDWSMEQLWLVFVMLKKFNKVWAGIKITGVTESKGIVTSGKDWIKI